MKTIHIPFLMLVLIFFAGILPAQNPSSTTIYFTTLGNCGICQNRIQNAVKDLQGIDTVFWNIPKKQTTVTYDQTFADPYIIMHAIANVGHDNEWFSAPDSAYNLLVGSCCEYPRTINYDTVQVGYLYMMGIWIYPQGTGEKPETSFSVLPSAGSGIFYIIPGERYQLRNARVEVYSMSGTRVHSSLLNPGSENRIDLRSMPDGQFIVVIKEGELPACTARIIKAGQ